MCRVAAAEEESAVSDRRQDLFTLFKNTAKLVPLEVRRPGWGSAAGWAKSASCKLPGLRDLEPARRICEHSTSQLGNGLGHLERKHCCCCRWARHAAPAGGTSGGTLWGHALGARSGGTLWGHALGSRSGVTLWGHALGAPSGGTWAFRGAVLR
jgi:hypothetical protein